MNYKKQFYIWIFTLIGLFLHAQNPDLELTQGSRAVANGPTLNSGPFTFLKNTNNPTGNTYSAYSTNPLTVTFSISNPQYTSGAGVLTATGSPVNFGHAGGNPQSIIQRLSFAGVPQDANYTSSGATTIGTGIAAAAANSATAANYGVWLNVYTAALAGQPKNGKYYMADVTITFNRAVNNPILHIAGMGGNFGSHGFTAELELLSSTATSAITFSKISGTTELYATSNYIGNNGADLNGSPPGVANGSIQVNGTGITSLTFKQYVRGDGLGGPTEDWNGTSGTTGDAYTISVSTLESNLAITQTASTLTPDYCSDLTFTVSATNNGASNSPNTIVNALLPSGYTYVSSTASAGTYDNATGVWTIGTLNDQATATLTITAKAKPTGTYALTSTISGDNIDPAVANNSNTITPAPMAGSSAPVLSDTVANNICPSTSVSQAELNALVLSSTPSGATLVWYTDNSHTTVATFPITANGVYYAFYDFTGGCYTAPSAVTVSINSCTVSNICPATSVSLNTAFSGTAPAGSTLRWHTGTPATAANMLTQPQAGNITTSGTYYAAYYDSAAGCYSSTTPITVNIIACGGCYNDANTATAGIDTKLGITLLKRAGTDNDNWPMVRKSAHTVLESNTKGFVITRIANANLGNITNPQEGMMVYDTTDKCLKIYDGTVWSCFNQPACP
ncbi:DUF11 domain-containing protein [Chryseobacterium sp. SL1]|uniref:DUF11 domain-containing protein n=1 Tax=Chryseobacterium sp. SL1 TaxID=2995159 RepID=UPI0022727532|nr:DUF11 domain-containing protein [Chryseobacterium sp. SL1]MCY1660432.1 DUF11 domain-containing protein [Chryseobacterium sp. SL1]